DAGRDPFREDAGRALPVGGAIVRQHEEIAGDESFLPLFGGEGGAQRLHVRILRQPLEVGPGGLRHLLVRELQQRAEAEAWAQGIEDGAGLVEAFLGACAAGAAEAWRGPRAV